MRHAPGISSKYIVSYNHFENTNLRASTYVGATCASSCGFSEIDSCTLYNLVSHKLVKYTNTQKGIELYRSIDQLRLRMTGKPAKTNACNVHNVEIVYLSLQSVLLSLCCTPTGFSFNLQQNLQQ